MDPVLDIASSNDKRTAIENYIERFVGGTIHEEYEKQISIFFREFLRRWSKSQRKKDRFLKENGDWLDDFFVLSGPSSSTSEANVNQGGRPSKEFGDCSNRSKRRRTEELRRTCSFSTFLLLLLCIFFLFNLNVFFFFITL